MHTHAGQLNNPISGLAATRAAIHPPKRQRILKLPIIGWATTVAPSLFQGALRFVFPGPHTLPVEGSANHFSEAMPC